MRQRATASGARWCEKWRARPAAYAVPYIEPGVVHNSDSSLLTQWVKLIGDYIALLNSHQVGLYILLLIIKNHKRPKILQITCNNIKNISLHFIHFWSEKHKSHKSIDLHWKIGLIVVKQLAKKA